MALVLKNRKKVLFIMPGLGDGGSETALLNVLNMFVRNHHIVELVIEKKTVNARDEKSERVALPPGVNVYYLYREFMGGSHSKFIRKSILSRFIRRLDKSIGSYDLILSNFNTSDGFVEKYFPNKVYYWVHFDFKNQMQKYYEHSRSRGDKYKKKLKAYFNNKNLIFVSLGAAESLLSLSDIKPRRTEVIYNMFDINRVRELAKKEQSKLPDSPYIIHAARFDISQKRQDLLFEAFKNVNPLYKLVLLTRSCKRLSKMIYKEGLSNRVVVADYQENPYPWIKNARLLILCSDYEGFGMVIAEALICNTEVISTDCPSGPAEILKEELSGNLVPCNNAQALASKVNEVLVKKKSERCFNHHVKKFSQENIFSQYLNLIKN